MAKIIVKICGLKSAGDVIMCQEHGADILGFVVDYPILVPWNLSAGEAETLLTFVKKPAEACIVTGGSPEKIIELAKRLRPSYIQLHFKETLADTQSIAASLKPLDIRVIKTFPLSGEERFYQFGTDNIGETIKRLCETEIFAILVDSRTPANPAETGTPANLDFFTQVKRLSSKPVILAGGITPDNVRGILERSGAEWIDVMTGTEESHGIKDGIKTKAFFMNIKEI